MTSRSLANEVLRAIETGDVVSLSNCIERGYVVGKDDQETDLHFAAQTGNAEVVRLLLDHLTDGVLDSFDLCGFTPLIRAADEGHLEIVKLLLKAGSDVNAYSEVTIGNTALREVVAKCSIEMALALLDAGADPSIKGWMGKSALDVARRRQQKNGDTESIRIVEALIRNDHGSDLSPRGTRGIQER